MDIQNECKVPFSKSLYYAPQMGKHIFAALSTRPSVRHPCPPNNFKTTDGM